MNANNRISHSRLLSLPTLRNALAALMLGVVAGVIALVAERADLFMTGGNLQLLGYINTYTWILVSVLLFGFWGAIITTEIQAMIGLITMTNPALSWLWPFVNLIFAVSVGLVAVGFSKLRSNAKISTKLLLLSSVCALLDIPLVYFVMVTVLSLPVVVYLAALPVYIILQLVPSTFLAYWIVRALKRSKALNLGE
ncbi:MAG: hypothetical protein FWD52_03305 [Candidatus Bathyarchaeota archaeon]|nr:hypothetical protein [Candidatus Termiticorpusculum sp.]